MKKRLLVLTLFAILAIVMTWPVADQIGTHLPGGSDDLWIHRWTFWWVKRALSQGQSLFHTNLLFHPHGVSLLTHNVAWVNIALWLPLQALIGGNAAYSLLFIVVPAFNGFAMYLLAHELTRSQPAALIGGVIYGFWPYALSHYGHPNMMLTGWVPLAMLQMHQTLKTGQMRHALAAGLFLALTGLTRWQMLIMAAVALGLFAGADILNRRDELNRQKIGRLLLIGGIAMLAMAPLAVPVAVHYVSQTESEDVLTDEARVGQTDLLAYIVPHKDHPLWNQTAENYYTNFVDNKVYVAFLGYSTLFLAIWGCLKHWKRARIWLLMGLIYVVLALGPELRINGHLFPRFPMPYRLLERIWFVRLLRKPDRLNVMLGLPVGMMAALGIDALRPRRARQYAHWAIAAVIGLAILFEYALVPYPTAELTVPDWYETVANRASDFAILDVPMNTYTFDKRYMFYQITHQKPLVEGHISRLPHDARRVIQKTAAIRAFAETKRLQADPTLSLVDALAELEIRYVVIHKQLLTPDLLANWQAALATRPVYEDEWITVFDTRPRADVHYEQRHTFGDLQLSQAWIEPEPTPVLESHWSSTTEETIRLTLHSHSEAPLTQAITIPESAFVVVRTPLSALAMAPYGEARLSLSTGSDSFHLPQQLTIASEQWSVSRLRPDAVWGEAIVLRGLGWHRVANTLHIELEWEALQDVERDYKFFIHLVKDGSLVSQYDGVPANWTRPTTTWQAGETIQEQVPIDLEDAPGGDYALAIGWYDPETGERMPAIGTAAESLPDGQLRIDGLTIAGEE